MVEHNEALLRVVDTQGRTPLHYATDKGCVESIRKILDVDKLVAYLTTSQFDKERTALHIAANVNSVKKMKEILSHCPDSWEMVDGEGQNILHIAIKEGSELVLKYILQQPWSQYLLNQKNNEGDTPIHILAADDEGNMDILLPHQRVDLASVNNQNMTPHGFIRIRSLAGKKDGRQLWWNILKHIISLMDPEATNKKKSYENVFLFSRYDRKKQTIILRGDPCAEKTYYKVIESKEEMKKGELEKMKKVAESHLIVGTLIATVTFAAGFTLPGGYDSNNGPNQGMAILRESSAFKAFMIMNTIAMMLSVSAVFMIFIAPNYRNVDDQIRCYNMGGELLMYDIGPMVIAFMTGAYAVLPKSPGIAIAVFIIIWCTTFFYLFFRT